jgi:NhaP-type Na+/H+ or K+/H+ antiporter
MQEKEKKTRNYFSFFLSVYFFVLSLLTPFEVLPSSGRPTAIHLILSLIFCVLGVVFFLRGLKVVVFIWGQAQK